jgi:hypothetical protein
MVGHPGYSAPRFNSGDVHSEPTLATPGLYHRLPFSVVKVRVAPNLILNDIFGVPNEGFVIASVFRQTNYLLTLNTELRQKNGRHASRHRSEIDFTPIAGFGVQRGMLRG